MQVTKTFVDRHHDGGNVVATATVYFDDCFAVHDIRILANGLIAMPNRQTRKKCKSCMHACNQLAAYCERCGCVLPGATGKLYVDIAHPLSRELRAVIESAIRGVMCSTVEAGT